MLRIRTTTPGCAKSEVVLGKADKLVKEFVYRGAIACCLPESAARDLGGKIFTFGSYRMFEHMLRQREDVTDVAPAPGAYVPLIAVNFMGIAIDFLFARLSLARIDLG
ncbi:unnamed protein product [Tilletia controversa]|nr:unnamed protein product [Tilletia controversa]CAD6973859.1 unnamed protein product [Tilletia controversa]